MMLHRDTRMTGMVYGAALMGALITMASCSGTAEVYPAVGEAAGGNGLASREQIGSGKGGGGSTGQGGAGSGGSTGQGGAGACGDGIVDEGEDCDDMNLAKSDGCSSSCKVESGASCDNKANEPSNCTFKIVINEIYFSPPPVTGSDSGCYIELYGPSEIILNGYVLEIYNSNGNLASQLLLSGKTSKEGYFVIRQDSNVEIPNGFTNVMTNPLVDTSDSPTSIRLTKGSKPVDALAYGKFESTQGQISQGEGPMGMNFFSEISKLTDKEISLSRFGADMDNNDTDFKCGQLTAGRGNLPQTSCP